MMQSSLRTRALGKWTWVLPSLGIEKAHLTGKHCPCPICGGKDRFRFDDSCGNGTWICSRCRAGDGVQLVMIFNGWNFSTAASEIEAVLSVGWRNPTNGLRRMKQVPTRPVQENSERLWNMSAPARRDEAVDTYLQKRGLYLAQCELERFRYHPSAFVDAGLMFPAMMTAVSDAQGTLVNVLRTFITNDGRQADIPNPKRLMRGSVPAGSAIRLSLASSTMGIAEGVETALSATALFGVPCWAALNASLLASWVPPREARQIIIFADNDSSYVGQRAAHRLDNRLSLMGIDVQLLIPE